MSPVATYSVKHGNYDKIEVITIFFYRKVETLEKLDFQNYAIRNTFTFGALRPELELNVSSCAIRNSITFDELRVKLERTLLFDIMSVLY